MNRVIYFKKRNRWHKILQWISACLRNEIPFWKYQFCEGVKCYFTQSQGRFLFTTLYVHRATAEIRQKKEDTEWSSFMKSHKEMSVVLLAAACQYTEFWQLVNGTWKPPQTEKAWGSWILVLGRKKEGERESKTHIQKICSQNCGCIYWPHFAINTLSGAERQPLISWKSRKWYQHPGYYF